MSEQSFILTRDTKATLIPAGDVMTLSAGTEVVITQALGGAVTFTCRGNLYRLGGEDLDALGEDAFKIYAASEAHEVAEGEFSEEAVWQALKSCYDPEIPINIVDLGLIYDLTVEDGAEPDLFKVSIKMTLTAQGCGMGPAIAEDARQKILRLPAVESADVEIVWDPQWTPHMISDKGRKKLGLT